MHDECYVRSTSSKLSLKRVPPSYSTVLKLGAPLPHYGLATYSSLPFIARQPPPSYAEVNGGWDEEPSIVSADSLTLGPNPVYVSCPRCRSIVISDIHTERSNLAHITSLILCVCMCWPCCLLPYCVKNCRNTYHFCPRCHYYLGVYRPCWIKRTNQSNPCQSKPILFDWLFDIHWDIIEDNKAQHPRSQAASSRRSSYHTTDHTFHTPSLSFLLVLMVKLWLFFSSFHFYSALKPLSP